MPMIDKEKFFIIEDDEKDFVADLAYVVNAEIPTRDKPRKCMMDSGSTFHLICYKFLREEEKATLRCCKQTYMNIQLQIHAQIFLNHQQRAQYPGGAIIATLQEDTGGTNVLRQPGGTKHSLHPGGIHHYK